MSSFSTTDMSSLAFRYLEHMTDVIVEAYGGTLEQAFENSALGLVNIMFDVSQVTPNQEIKIEARGYDLESLLYDWLEKVMLVLLVDNIIISTSHVKIFQNINDGLLISSISKGEYVNIQKHHYKVEIKAVTYHEMEIKQEKNSVIIRYLLDL